MMPEIQLETIDLHGANSGQPKYAVLKGYLEGELASGRLKPGQALPSEATLVSTLKVARNTVRQALGQLEREGLLRRVQGKGTFVSDQAREHLRTGFNMFTVIVPETNRPTYTALLHGFEGVCRERNCQTILRSTDNDVGKQADAILQILDSRLAGGVALVPALDRPTPAYQIRELHRHDIPVVFCHRGVSGVEAPLLPIPFLEVGRLAGRALVEQGHRRVAFFARLRTIATQARGYEQGLREAVRAGGGDLPEAFVHYGSSTSVNLEDHKQEIFEALERICGEPDRPTAIFATFDPLAELIYLLLGRLGLRVPEDISLVSVGVPWRDGPIAQELTSVVLPELEMGRRAAELLDEMRRGERPLNDSQEIVLPLSWIEGRTLAPAHQRSAIGKRTTRNKRQNGKERPSV